MKNSNSKFNFIGSFKYFMIAPIVMVLAAIIVGLICGFNYDYDYRTVSSFTVKFNTTVTEAEYDILEDEITKIVKNADYNSVSWDYSYRIEKIGENAQNGIIVKIVNEDGAYDGVIDDVKVYIEDNLYTNVADKIDKELYISTTETLVDLPANSTNLIWFTVLAVVCIVVVAFLYTFIRYNLMTGVSTALAILLSVAMLTALNIILRIPMNVNFVFAYSISALITVFISSMIANAMKPTLSDDKYAKYSNAERVYSVVNLKFVISTLVALALVLVPVLLVSIFAYISTVYTILSIVVGMLTAIFSSVFFAPSIWSFWYNREADTMLKRRKDREKKKLESNGKEDEKIVV